MKNLMSIFIFLSYLSVSAQDTDSVPTISIDSISIYENQVVSICDKIYGGIYLDKSKKRITLLNMGGAYPNQKLTVLIPDSCRFLFSKAPENYFKYKYVCVTGQLILYNKKYEIILTKPRDIVLKKSN
jgi:hypothetical protein